MANLWRRQPTRRLSSYNLIKKESSSQSVSIANEFFEAVVGPTVTIVANDFPMVYFESPAKAEELRSKVSGATITRVANSFPHELIKSGKAKDLRSKWT